MYHFCFKDVHTDVNQTSLKVDVTQNCANFDAKVSPASGIVFTFTRSFDTCDEKDYLIEDGTTNVLWAYGNGPLYNLNGLDLGNKNIATTGFSRTRLLKVEPTNNEFPADSKNLEIRHIVDLPPDDTTYWCSVHKLPNAFTKKHHAIQVCSSNSSCCTKL